MQRPALSLQTVFFHESDREQASRLGTDLYEHLTRRINDPLGYGANIPVLVAVSAARVEVDAAEVVIVVPILGRTTFNLQGKSVVDQLQAWHQRLGPGHVLPVPTSSNWRSEEGQLPGVQLLTELYAVTDPRRKTLDEIVMAVTRLLDPDPVAVRLFVSHAKADLQASEWAAKKIHDYVVTEGTGSAFFDTTDLRPGESLPEQLDEAVGRGVVIAVRGDSYGSRVWCQHELLQAKRLGIPTLTVEVLREGEQRSSPYLGNSPSMVWTGNPAPVVSRAMVEWVRAAHFRREAPRIIKGANLPDSVKVATRPPELLDLAQGPLRSDFAQLVLYPDPELSAVERQVLRAAHPRLHLVTPTTAFRRLLNRGDQPADVSSPLEGMQVAMSLSDKPATDGPEGSTAHHLVDATVYIARSLISAGAAIAYGGDFRKTGFTVLLAQLIQSHNQTASKSAQRLHSYLAATISPEAAPEDLALTMHHLVQSPEVACDAMMPAPSPSDLRPGALYLSDMRRVMAKHTQARVILGGNREPRSAENGSGYGGRYPGVVEEAWRTLEMNKPLYVLGGFGGGAGLVADLLEGKQTPAPLLDDTWISNEYFSKRAAAIDVDPFREKLGLPRLMKDLVEAIRTQAMRVLQDDHASLGWNGLTVDENRQLFRSRDPVALACLVSKGLLRIARRESADQLKIELVHDSVTAASKLDVIVIATLDQVPLAGAGAVLDQAVGGRATAARAKGISLISLQDVAVDAQWLLMISLGSLDDVTALPQRVEQAAHETAEVARRHGFSRVGVVTFGGSLLSDVESIARAMTTGLRALPALANVVWFETNAERYRHLQSFLGQQTQIKLTTQRASLSVESTPHPKEPLILDVRLEGSKLAATALLPSGSAIAAIQRHTVSEAQLNMFSEGSGHQMRGTPDRTTLQARGVELAKALLGKNAAEILARCRDSKVVVMHDVSASRLPFEMLATLAPEVRPALESGMSRRLVVDDVPVASQFAQPPKNGRLNVLLIVNPTQDLAGAEAEAQAVRDILAQQKDRVSLTVLQGQAATKEAVSHALARADVLHYCGHAFFDGLGMDESGVILANTQRFTGTDLRRIEPLPRMAFVNACEAGRVRGQMETEAAAFAELFLRSGVEAYIGTYWRVQDRAAASFATRVYAQLAVGETLETAVLLARRALHAENQLDWANYILFGGGSFRLMVEA